MSENVYTLDVLPTQELVQAEQWQRLQAELGEDMLIEFALEYMDETADAWIRPDTPPQSMEDSAFRSLAHRSAGVAGTLGLQRLRHVFLCLEHEVGTVQRPAILAAVSQVYADTLAVLKAQSGGAV